MSIGAIDPAMSGTVGRVAETTQNSDLTLPSAQQTVNQQDAQAFANAIDQSSLAENVLNKLQSLSESAQVKGEELERMVLKATETLNPMDMIEANRVMSEYYLENLMTAKLIGNASKAIERLTSLQ